MGEVQTVQNWLNSNCGLRVSMEEKQPGRISDLPNEVLRHMMRFLPMESVAQTRLLSTRWRDLLNVRRDHGRISVTSTEILGMFTPTVYQPWLKALNYPWNLEFRYRKSGERFLVATVCAKSLKLCLDFSHGHLPDVPSWLTCLQLMLTYLSCSTDIPIRSVRLTSNGHLYCDVVSSLLSNIQFLERIEIAKSQALSDVSIFGHVKLSHVSIIDCVEVESIHVFASTLESLRCHGRCPSVFISAPCKLKDVMLDFRQGPVDASLEYGPIKHLLWNTSYVAEANYITICMWTFQVLIKPTLSVPFIFLKELWWIDNRMEGENVNSLISFLNVCPVLEKLFVTIDPMCYRLPNNYICKNHNIEYEICTPLGFGRLRRLEMVKLDGFEHEEDLMFLVDSILSITERNPEVVSSSPNSCTRRLVKVDPNRKEFVEETRSDMLKVKHIHMSI